MLDIQDFNERMRDERIARNCKRLKFGVVLFLVALLGAAIRQAMGV
jgi:hypothetical protein